MKKIEKKRNEKKRKDKKIQLHRKTKCWRLINISHCSGFL